jgi:hypothetical protein
VVAVLALGALVWASCGSDGGDAATDQTRVTTTGVTTPPPPVPPTPTEARPLRVLLLGDGLMWDSTPAIRAGLATLGPSIVEDDAYWGFALSRPQWRDWRTLWPGYVDAFAPDVVAVSFGIHDTEPQVDDGVLRDPASPDWPAWYSLEVHKAVQELTAHGAVVYWLGLPPVGDPAVNARIDDLNRITRQAVEVDPRGHFVDTTAAFAAPDGTAAATDASGLPLRKLDLLHMCAQGAGTLADTFVSALAADLGTVVDPSFLTGRWRADERYGQDGPAGCRVTGASS